VRVNSLIFQEIKVLPGNPTRKLDTIYEVKSNTKLDLQQLYGHGTFFCWLPAALSAGPQKTRSMCGQDEYSSTVQGVENLYFFHEIIDFGPLLV
jgi:hypothetical protein